MFEEERLICIIFVVSQMQLLLPDLTGCKRESTLQRLDSVLRTSLCLQSA
jgi:hypothetical protein